MLFAQAFPAGAQLLPVTAPAGPVKVWATRAIDGTIRVTAINQDATAEHDVQVVVPNATAPGAVETMAVPALDAPTGVTLGGQTFGAETTTGTFPASPATTTSAPAGGVYTVPLAAGNAALLTIAQPSTGTGGTGLIRRAPVR
jgi:hypothetical protein